MRDYVFIIPSQNQSTKAASTRMLRIRHSKKRINSLLISVLFSVKLRPFTQLIIKHQTHQSPHCGNLDFLQLKI